MITQRYIKFVIYTLHCCILPHPSTCIYATLSCLLLSVCPYSPLPAHPLHCRLSSRAHRSPRTYTTLSCLLPWAHPLCCRGAHSPAHPLHSLAGTATTMPTMAPHIHCHYRGVYVRGYRDSVLRTLMGVVVHASARRYLYSPVDPSEARMRRVDEDLWVMRDMRANEGGATTKKAAGNPTAFLLFKMKTE